MVKKRLHGKVLSLNKNFRMKILFIILLIISLILAAAVAIPRLVEYTELNTEAVDVEPKSGFIKWVDFKITPQALRDAMDIDIKSQNEAIKINWIDILSYLGAKCGGDFKKYSKKDLIAFTEKLKQGESIEELTKDMKHYSYYKEAYTAVLKEFVGSYKIETPVKGDEDKKVFESKYGLKAFSPIAKTFPYQDYDDFGVSRTYGYKRKHLGHDMMAATGTPVIAIESGTVEAVGWNQYGGWRIGIRSFDKKRYYYYAHLRKNRPYHADLTEGKTVNAGDVIGYVGRTGYSTDENANNIDTMHLHVGLQLIFDESQKEGNNEIWIDIYPLIQLLEKNRSEVYKVSDTKEYYRKFEFEEDKIEY